MRIIDKALFLVHKLLNNLGEQPKNNDDIHIYGHIYICEVRNDDNNVPYQSTLNHRNKFSLIFIVVTPLHY